MNSYEIKHNESVGRDDTFTHTHKEKFKYIYNRFTNLYICCMYLFIILDQIKGICALYEFLFSSKHKYCHIKEGDRKHMYFGNEHTVALIST